MLSTWSKVEDMVEGSYTVLAWEELELLLIKKMVFSPARCDGVVDCLD